MSLATSVTTSSGGSAAGGNLSGSATECSLGLLDLPDELLSKVLVTVGRQGSVALVCKRMHGVMWAQPALWRELRITADKDVASQSVSGLAAWFEGQHHLLQRVAHVAEDVTFSVGVPGAEEVEEEEEEEEDWHDEAVTGRLGWRMPALLSALAGSPSVRSVTFSVWGLQFSWAETAALGQLRGLTRLRLGSPKPLAPSGRCHLPSSGAAALRQLTALRDLHLSVHVVPSALLSAVLSLRQLTRLTLCSLEPLPAGVRRLSCLTRLEALRLHERASSREGLCLPEPAFLDRLKDLQCGARLIQVPVEGGWDTLRGCVTDDGESPLFVEMYQCQCCVNRTLLASDVCMQHSPPLLPLLRGSGVGVGPCEHLRLVNCHLAADAVATLAPAEHAMLAGLLSPLRYLDLDHCFSVEGDDGVGPFLGRLLALAPNLEQLRLDSCGLSEAGLPEALGAAPKLFLLELHACGLTGLPGGAYMEGLVYLSLKGNRLSELPPSIASATQLSDLSLAANPDLELTWPADVACLKALPSLEKLELWGTRCGASPAMLAMLRCAVPDMWVLDKEHPEDEGW